MRELIVTENITVDGVIDMAKGWFDPAGPPGVDTSDLQQVLREQGAASDALLLGRQTFEDFRGYWPLQTDDTTGTTDYLNQVAKYVVSSTLQDPEWENTTVLRGDPIEEVRALKAMPGDLDIIATGSMQLVTALVASGLVDEYRLFVYPFVAGEGQRLFADATELGALRLVEAQSYRSGVVQLRYRP
jgi:dihydrofolate reductase